jgi:phosphatidylglycerophosphate synthase
MLDAAREPTYISNMRRHLRPAWFPMPAAKNHRRAERVILAAAQKGTLDIPAYVHAPIETTLVRWLCRTSITPMQLTYATTVFGILVTVFFATGRLWFGTIMALIVGVLDGVDGKQARVKVETTRQGEWEHYIDRAFEASWWLALGWFFQHSGALRAEFACGLGIIIAELIERPFGKACQRQTGRLLDDVSRFDRWFRLVSARRNIFIWLFAIGMFVHRPAEALVALFAWQIVTTFYSLVRWLQLCVLAPA